MWSNQASGRRDKLRECFAIHDQGECGWCAAHAMLGSLEAVACTLGLEGFHPSVPHLWYAGHGLRDFTAEDCRGGWYVEDAAQSLRATTLIHDQAWESHYQWDHATNASAMNESRRNVDFTCDPMFAATAFSDSDATPQALRAALDRGGFPIVSLPIYKNTGWLTGEPSFGAIDVPASYPPGECRCDCMGASGCTECKQHPHCVVGYHAVVLVDHDPVHALFELANSWTDTWGDRGYGTITDRAVIRSARSVHPVMAAIRQRPATCDQPPPGEIIPVKGCGRVTGDITERLQCIDEAVGGVGMEVDAPGAPARWRFGANQVPAGNSQDFTVTFQWYMNEPRVGTYALDQLTGVSAILVRFGSGKIYTVLDPERGIRGELELKIKSLERGTHNGLGVLAAKGSIRARMPQVDGPGFVIVETEF